MKLHLPKPSTAAFALAVVAAALSPAVLDMPQQSLLTRALIFGLMAASLDIAYGHGGLASLGHSALAGVGGYTAGILMVKHGIDSFFLGILIAVVVSALVSLIFGLLALRAKGIYFILATFTLGQMLSNLALQWKALKSPGVEAIVGIGWPSFGFIDNWVDYWDSTTILRAVLVVVVVAFLCIRRILGSPFGQSLRGVRDNAERMEALGYHAWAYRLASIVISGAFAGLAGALFAYHSGIITPSNIGIAASGVLVLMVILGGSGSTYGPLIGGMVVTAAQFYASEWSEARAPLVIGAIYIVTALALRGGVAGAVATQRRRWRQARGSA